MTWKLYATSRPFRNDATRSNGAPGTPEAASVPDHRRHDDDTSSRVFFGHVVRHLVVRRLKPGGNPLHNQSALRVVMPLGSKPEAAKNVKMPMHTLQNDPMPTNRKALSDKSLRHQRAVLIQGTTVVLIKEIQKKWPGGLTGTFGSRQFPAFARLPTGRIDGGNASKRTKTL